MKDESDKECLKIELSIKEEFIEDLKKEIGELEKTLSTKSEVGVSDMHTCIMHL